MKDDDDVVKDRDDPYYQGRSYAVACWLLVVVLVGAYPLFKLVQAAASALLR